MRQITRLYSVLLLIFTSFCKLIIRCSQSCSLKKGLKSWCKLFSVAALRASVCARAEPQIARLTDCVCVCVFLCTHSWGWEATCTDLLWCAAASLSLSLSRFKLSLVTFSLSPFHLCIHEDVMQTHTHPYSTCGSQSRHSSIYTCMLFIIMIIKITLFV